MGLSEEEFREEIDIVINHLNLRKSKIEITSIDKSEQGFSYNAIIEHENGTVIIDAFTEYELPLGDKEDVLLVRYAFYMKNEFNIYQFISSKVYSIDDYPLFKQYIVSTLKEYSKSKVNEELAFKFGDRPIFILGDETSNLSLIAFRITLAGYISSFDPHKVLILRIRHLRKGPEIYSYAILIENNYGIWDYTYWALFPKFCGGGGGTGEGVRRQIEGLLEKVSSENEGVQIQDLDIDEKELDKFIERYKNTFSSNGYRKELLYNPLWWVGLPIHFETEYQKIIKDIHDDDLNRALGNMRGLFEELAKKVLGIGKEEYLNSGDIGKKLVSTGKSEKRIKKWISVFYTYSNPPRHMVPEKKEFSVEEEEELYLSLCVGKKLLAEMLKLLDIDQDVISLN